jgi:thiol-disulfide isomerase/thioredoxin
MERSSIKSALLNAAMGFLALCLLIAIMALSDVGNDLRIFLMVTALVYSLAGFLRGKSPTTNPWLNGVLVNAGGLLGAVIASATHAAFTASGAMVLFVLASLLPAMIGAKTRQLWARGSRRWALAHVFLLASAVVLASMTLMPSIAARMFTHPVDRPVSSFSLSSLDGRAVNSSELKGHVVVLTFWATWCAPCMSEMPRVERAMERYKDNPQVTFWAVDAEWGGDTVDKARTFSLDKGWKLPQAFDSTGAARVLGVKYPPTLLMLDKAGHLRMVHVGYDASEDLAENVCLRIEKMLSGPS